MSTFLTTLQHQLAQFSPYLTQEITLYSPFFQRSRGSVQQFIDEILLTAHHLTTQSQQDYSDYYADHLIKQFSTLKRHLDRLVQQRNSTSAPYFTHTFPQNVHYLPPKKRLVEYQKALRALNEKLVWLTQQCYQAEKEKKIYFQRMIEETEQRKQKCLWAIQKTEEEM